MLGSLWFSSFSSGAVTDSAYELISTTVLGSAAASVTFSGLGTSAAAYKHLQIRVAARADTASGYVASYLRFNGDSGTNYSQHELDGTGTSVVSFQGANTTSSNLGYITAASSSASIFGAVIADILDWQSVKNKTVRGLSGSHGSSTLVSLTSGAWYSTATVTSITALLSSGNFVTGSRFSLYGLR